MKVGFNPACGDFPLSEFFAWLQKSKSALLSLELEEEHGTWKVGTILGARLTRPKKERGKARHSAATLPPPLL
jgi:hypothetical protein